MKIKKRVLAALLTAVIFLTAPAPAFSETIYEFPPEITSVGAEAFSDTSMPKHIFMPAGLTEISPDAFSDPTGMTIYGFTGSAAQTYAQSSGAAFVSVDITQASLTAPAWASPYVPVIFSANAVSGGNLTYEFTVLDGETVLAESGTITFPEFSYTFTKSGRYSARVRIQNRYAQAEAALTRPVEIADPIETVTGHLFMSVGETARVISETETRNVTLEVSDTQALTANENSITAHALGSYSVTLKAETAEGVVYTVLPVDVAVEPESVIVNAEKKRVNAGASLHLTAEVYPEDATYRQIVWSVSDESIGVIREDGLFTAKTPGKITVYADCANARGEYNLTVVAPVASVEIDASRMPETVYSGMRFPLSAITKPVTAYDGSVTWSSDNEASAMIDPFTGIVSALDAGEVTVNARANDGGGAFASFVFTVHKGAESISFEKNTLIADPGDVLTVVYTVSPADAQGQTVVWESSAPAVAEVENGVITCLSSGQCTITAKAPNGVSASISLTVAKPVQRVETLLPEVYVNPGTTLSPLDSFVFITPSDSEYRALSWSSDAPDIVHVNEKTGILSSVLTGSAVITGTAHNGKTVSFTVHVVSDAKVVSTVALSSVYGVLTVGSTGTLTRKLSPLTKYSDGVWYSDNENVLKIVTVDSNDRVAVKGVGTGHANLYYIAASGLRAVCPIVVNPVVARTLTINASSIALNVGDAFPLAVSYQPSSATARDITWYCANPLIAEVDENGLLRALSGGTTIVTAACEDGARATCTVTVNPIPMTEAALKNTSVTMTAGDTMYAEYTFAPENATPAAFVWTSGNSRIASVEPMTGLINALEPGNTVITAAALDGSGIKLALRLTVTETPIEAFIVSTQALDMNPGEEGMLAVRVLPPDASYAAPVFVSSNEDVAVVDPDGRVLAVADGECEITVTVGRGEYAKTASVAVTVHPVNDVVYRALIMGQFTDPASEEYLPFANNSTKGIRDALSRSIIDGHKYDIRYLSGDPSPSAIKSAIASIAQTADENDVTVIYFLTHGNYSSETGYAMHTSHGRDIMPSEMLNSVKTVSGHVVLILCTCNSGRIFASSAGSAVVSSGGLYMGNNGEGRLSILCASTNTLSSYYRIMDERLSYDFYSYATARALGWNMLSDGSIGHPLADKNSDGKVTVSELASFTRTDTQRAISAFIQKYGSAEFSGNENQFPRWNIAEGDNDLVIFSK